MLPVARRLRRPAPIAALAAVVLALHAGAAAAGPNTLLILPLEHELGGEQATKLKPVEETFRTEAKALGRYRVLPTESTATLLDSVRTMGLDCKAGDIECLTKAGVIMEIGFFVVMRAALSGETLIFTAQLVDVDTGRARAAVSRTVQESASFRAVMRSAAVELLAPDLFVGALEITVSQPGATVRVDGAERGKTPLPANVSPLAPGQHVVRVDKAGFQSIERIVDVKPLETTALLLNLEPVKETVVADGNEGPAGATAAMGAAPPVATTNPLPVLPIVFGSVGGVAVLATAGTGIGAFVMNERLKDVALASEERVDARSAGLLLVVAAVTTGVIGTAALGAAAFTFWGL